MCNTPILPGELYRRARVIGDDGPYVWKEHPDCAEIGTLALSEYGDDDGYDYELAYEFARDQTPGDKHFAIAIKYLVRLFWPLHLKGQLR